MLRRTDKHHKRFFKPHKKRSTVRKKDFTTEHALGDGNCAFNAFALGLFTPEVIAEIEKNLKAYNRDPNDVFAPFIEDVYRAATNQGVKIQNNWESVKNLLLGLRLGTKNQKVLFQKALGPILRNASVQLARIHVDEYLTLTKEPMMSAFRDYVDHKLGIGFRGGVDDDVYNQHGFIQLKFGEFSKDLNHAISESKFDIKRYTELKKSEVLGEEEELELVVLESRFSALVEKIQNSVLWSWWSKKETGGFYQFLDAMADQEYRGEINKWAGDYELYPLAKFFGVNLDVEKQGSPYHIFINHGSFPKSKLKEDQIKDLTDRGIIDRPSRDAKEIQFLRIDPEELAIRLSAFPEDEREEVELFFLDYETVSPKDALVPDHWSDILLQQLYVRDMIRPIQGGRNYVFNLSVVDARKRMTPVENPEGIIALWQEYARSNPTVTLENEDATHWNNKHLGEVVVRGSALEHVSKDKEKLPKKKKHEKEEDTDLSENYKAFEKQLLFLLDKDDKKVKFVETNRNGLFIQAQKEAKALADTTLKGKKRKAVLKSGKYVEYFFDDKKSIVISKETQIELDKEYAKKLQQKYYARRRVK